METNNSVDSLAKKVMATFSLGCAVAQLQMESLKCVLSEAGSRILWETLYWVLMCYTGGVDGA